MKPNNKPEKTLIACQLNARDKTEFENIVGKLGFSSSYVLRELILGFTDGRVAIDAPAPSKLYSQNIEQ